MSEWKSCRIVFNTLFTFATSADLGDVAVEVSFCCFPNNPSRLRQPGSAFIRADRLAGVPDEGFVTARPDLAVEVISPADGVYDLGDKLVDFRSAETPPLRIINPAAQIVRVCRAGRFGVELLAADTLDDGVVADVTSSPTPSPSPRRTSRP